MPHCITRRSLIGGAAGIAASGILAGTSRAQSTSVKFMFDVLPNPKHGLFYPAVELGFFKDNRLDVAVESGKGSADVIQNVASGAVDFGFADAGALILARSRGIPVVLVGMVHYTTLMSIITRTASAIRVPSDLMGKKIAATSGDAVRTAMPALAKINGFNADKIEWTSITQAAKATVLLAGQVDGVCDYLSAFPIYKAAAKAQNIELSAISFGDHGLDVYSNGIIVTEDTLRSRPELVKSFLSALYKGMAFAAKDRDEAVKIFRKAQPQYEVAVTREGLEIALTHLLVPEVYTAGLGAMSSEKMSRTIRTTVEAYALSTEITPASVFTNAMLPGITP